MTIAFSGMTIDRKTIIRNDEAEAEHQGEDDRGVHPDYAVEVGDLRRHATHIDLRRYPFKSGGNVLVAERGHLVGRLRAVRLSGERERHQGQNSGI